MANKSNDTPDATTTVLAGVIDALTPRAIKALSRLIDAGVDIPTAWLERYANNIRTKTDSRRVVETAIAEQAASLASSDPVIVERAMNNLLRKEYRRSENRASVAFGAIELLRDIQPEFVSAATDHASVDEDWLNVFERFAEDASTERMQQLWSRVFAGEIRRPGAYSLRTLRFLSEFAQSDAMIFAEFCQNAINDTAPRNLVLHEGVTDIRHLMQLEAAGLITGVTVTGLQHTFGFDSKGHAFWTEGKLTLIFRGEPSTSLAFQAVGLTPLGKELMSLLPDRDLQSVMRNVAQSVKSAQIKAAFIGHVISNSQTKIIEELWLDHDDVS